MLSEVCITRNLSAFASALVILLGCFSAAHAEEARVKETSEHQESEFYMRAVQRKIKRYWIPPNNVGAQKVVMQFRIYSDGSIACLRVYRSSKNNSVDKTALAAVRAAAPFQPLPEGAPFKVDVRFTLESKSHQE